MKKINDPIILFCDSSSGVYIPQRFANEIKRDCVTGISDDNYDDLLDPNNELYWDTWELVCNNAEITDHNGNKYSLHYDGDLWLLDLERMTDDEKSNFFEGLIS